MRKVYTILILVLFSCSEKKIETLSDTKKEIYGIWEPVQKQENIAVSQYPIIEFDTTLNSMGDGPLEFTSNTINKSKFGLLRIIGNVIIDTRGVPNSNQGKVLHDVSKSFFSIQKVGLINLNIKALGEIDINWKLKLLNSNEAILNDNVRYVKTNKKIDFVQEYFDSDFFNKFYRKFETLGSYFDLNETPSLSNNIDHIGTIKAIHRNSSFKNDNYKDVTYNVPRFVEIQINNGHNVYVNFEDKERFENDKEIMKLFDQFIIGRKINFVLYTEGTGELSQAYFSKLKFLKGEPFDFK